MRTYSSLVIALLAISCAGSQITPDHPTPAATGPAPADRARVVIPFHATTVTRRGVPSDDVSGTAEVLPTALRVVLRAGNMELTASSGARPRTVQAVLAYGDTAQYHVRARSNAVPVATLPARADTLTDSVVFSIPLARDVVLNDHYLVIEIGADVNIPGRGWVSGAVRPLLSAPTLFRGTNQR